MGKKIGIDLGTTYSCMAYVNDHGIVNIIDNMDGEPVTPSVVYMGCNDGVITPVVGYSARGAGGTEPELVVERVKNFMGDPNYKLTYHGLDFSPAAISKIIMTKLIEDAKRVVGDIEGIVVTCPAYFGDAARAATKLAAENAGVAVYQVLDEPVAALMAYMESCSEEYSGNVLVYDLGGGTFDCTVAQVIFNADGKQINIITTDGHHQLGGKDWDNVLRNYFISEFCKKTGFEEDAIREDAEVMFDLGEKVERAKKNLTSKSTTIETIVFGGHRERIEITRETFDSLTEVLLNQTIQLVDSMMANKNMTVKDNIDKIMLVGGSTMMPQVRRRLEIEYGDKEIVQYEAYKAVAMGAAIRARQCEIVTTSTPTQEDGSTISGESQDSVVLIDDEDLKVSNTCNKSYGIIAYRNNEKFVGNIVIKDTLRPTSKMREFGTHVDNQRSVLLEVYENTVMGPDATIEESTELYESCEVELTSGLPAGSKLQITFDLDASGVLKITVLDVTNGVSKVACPVRVGNNASNIGMDVEITLGE